MGEGVPNCHSDVKRVALSPCLAPTLKLVEMLFVPLKRLQRSELVHYRQLW